MYWTSFAITSDQFLLCIKLFIVQSDLQMNQGQEKNFLAGFCSLKSLQLSEFSFSVEYEHNNKTTVNLKEWGQGRNVR